MNSTTVQKYLNQLPRDKIHAARVCASDLLPSTQILPSTAYVVNTMPHTDGGEHWVLFYLPPEDDIIEYFDSFGRAPYPSDYQKFLRRNARHRYVYNKYQLQSLGSSVCGLYCLCYLYCRLHHQMTMNEFVHLFGLSSGSSLFNDEFITSMFKKMFT